MYATINHEPAETDKYRLQEIIEVAPTGTNYSDPLEGTHSIQTTSGSDLLIYWDPHKNCLTTQSAKTDKINKLATTSQMLSEINEAFGLPVKDYERIFNIKRATYYNWKKGMEPADQNHSQKIDALYEIASEVKQFNHHAYGRLAKTRPVNGKTLLDLLSESPINKQAVIETCKNLTQLITARENHQPDKVSNVALSGVYIEDSGTSK